MSAAPGSRLTEKALAEGAVLCLPPHGSGSGDRASRGQARPGQEAADAEHTAGCWELGFRLRVGSQCSDLSSSSSPSLLPPTPQSPANLTCSFWSSECGERSGHEHLDLTDGQHLSSCYPSTCITDILLSYKHPEVSFSVEQAGV